MNHRLHFFMALSPREYEELAGYRAIRQFGDWKQGIHLGGSFLMSRVFLIMRSHLLRGAGLIRLEPHLRGREGRAVLFMTPFVKEGEHE